MERGKDVCEELKRVRQEIADANGIDYHPHPCTHEGDCMGTCPACEQEVRYLTQQLDNCRRLGKAVSIVGISTCLTAVAPVLSSCDRPTTGEPLAPLEGEPAFVEDSCDIDSVDCTDMENMIQGFVPIPKEEDTDPS